MDCEKLSNQWQYVERNGCCLNIDEKMRLGLAVKELKHDLGLKKVWLFGKITGKYKRPSLTNVSYAGIVKDYYMVMSAHGGQRKTFWASSSTWTFSELPNVLSSEADLAKLAQINNFFTGEFDSVLFASSGKAECIDAELGVYMQPKPVTELDRLSFVVNKIQSRFVTPKGYAKHVPTGGMTPNEAFSGLNKADCF